MTDNFRTFSLAVLSSPIKALVDHMGRWRWAAEVILWKIISESFVLYREIAGGVCEVMEIIDAVGNHHCEHVQQGCGKTSLRKNLTVFHQFSEPPFFSITKES